MFEITGEDVARLGDADLRTLVARLALAELAAQGLPRSAVTAGGHQDAKDGGIDVRVEVAGPMPYADFVPRPTTGFQVKRPDMQAAAIRGEMRKGGSLRPSIAALAAVGGAYVIVSAQGSVADEPLADRRKALREGLAGCADADRLRTDFFDRERLATWTNMFPGAAAWVRGRIGAPMSGWSTVGSWSDTTTAPDGGYLFSEGASVVAEGTGGSETRTVPEAIDVIRSKLAEPRQCLRLIGMSGVGKTRFVEALFESGIAGDRPLDPALSVYTDFAEDTRPGAREMARRLVDARQRAILVVDNCNPAVHGQLAEVCTAAGSQVSLITVEYDVRDDEPERTEVFRLLSYATDAVERWLEREFQVISPVDRRTIAKFSDGNFRVARALAETVRRGESLGTLRSQDLFERLFTQRNSPDQHLLRDAEVLALAYSFNGENESPEGEMATLATAAGRTVRDLLGSLADLRARSVVQSRGHWRAVLPQAIANRLAAGALRRMPREALDGLWTSASARLLKSMSRRLGYLHDSEEAKAAVVRWLDPTGPLGDLIGPTEIGAEIVANLAPAAPASVLAAIQRALDASDGALITATSNRARGRWIRLLRALAYEEETFDQAAHLLARFVAAEPKGHNADTARNPFAELFHIRLSGTLASPAQRVATARLLQKDGDASAGAAGTLALDGLLATGHFSSSAAFDFGARPRDFGWAPTTQREIDNWFTAAIALAVESAALPRVKAILGRHARGLWRLPAARDPIEAAADHFLATDGGWIDGWIGLRSAVRWDGVAGEDGRISALIERLKPIRLLERARATVLSQSLLGIDLADTQDGDPSKAWRDASDLALELGRAMTADGDVLTVFLPELLSQQAMRGFEFGRGLAQGSPDPAGTWAVLVAAHAAVLSTERHVVALGGFLSELHATDPGAADGMLEAALDAPELRSRMPYLQSRAALDAAGLDRLKRLAVSRTVAAWSFGDLAMGVVDGAEPERLVALLLAIAGLENGEEVAVDILHFRLHCDRHDGRATDERLLEHGRRLLLDFRIGRDRPMRDHHLAELVTVCLAGGTQEETARRFCRRLSSAINDYEVYAHDCHALFTALLAVQPTATLDELIDPTGDGDSEDGLFDSSFARASPIEDMDSRELIKWAELFPERRFGRLSAALPMFASESLGEVKGLAPVFVAMLARATDKSAFLGDVYARVHPNGWSGSLADNLERRKSMLVGLMELGDAAVDAWVAGAEQTIDAWVTADRARENRREERFE